MSRTPLGFENQDRRANMMWTRGSGMALLPSHVPIFLVGKECGILMPTALTSMGCRHRAMQSLYHISEIELQQTTSHLYSSEFYPFGTRPSFYSMRQDALVSEQMGFASSWTRWSTTKTYWNTSPDRRSVRCCILLPIPRRRDVRWSFFLQWSIIGNGLLLRRGSVETVVVEPE
jgi:hypothetical protein